MGSDIVLSAGVRQNLLALQDTARLMAITQNRWPTARRSIRRSTIRSISSRVGLDQPRQGLERVARRHGKRHQDDRGGRQRHHRHQADDRIDEVDAAAGAAGQVLQEHGLYRRPRDAGRHRCSDLLGRRSTGSVNIDLANSPARTHVGADYADLDFNNAGALDGQRSLSPLRSTAVRRAASSSQRRPTPTMTVAVDGGAATNYTIVDSDAVTGAEMRGALNAGFDAAATPVAITAAVQPARRSSSPPTPPSPTASPTSSSPPVSRRRPGRPGQLRLRRRGGTLTQTGTVAQTVDQIVAGINANANPHRQGDGLERQRQAAAFTIFRPPILTSSAPRRRCRQWRHRRGQTTTIGGNVVRRNLVKQFNDLRDQLDKLADDASFNGVNLLRGDRLKITFNETRHQHDRRPGHRTNSASRGRSTPSPSASTSC